MKLLQSQFLQGNHTKRISHRKNYGPQGIGKKQRILINEFNNKI